MDKISTLLPRVQILARELVKQCSADGIPIIVTQGLRTIAEQDELYSHGRTKPGQIVTNAKGGTSFHNYGVAFDICPYIGGKFLWSNVDMFKKVGEIGKKIGLEWGGDWVGFVDMPHFQQTLGKTVNDYHKEYLESQVSSLKKILASLRNGLGLS